MNGIISLFILLSTKLSLGRRRREYLHLMLLGGLGLIPTLAGKPHLMKIAFYCFYQSEGVLYKAQLPLHMFMG